jgi:hypothetical protein
VPLLASVQTRQWVDYRFFAEPNGVFKVVNGYVAAELWDVIRGADGQLLAKEATRIGQGRTGQR